MVKKQVNKKTTITTDKCRVENHQPFGYKAWGKRHLKIS